VFLKQRESLNERKNGGVDNVELVTAQPSVSQIDRVTVLREKEKKWSFLA